MANFELFSILIALLAAFISFLSLYRTHRVAMRQIPLQQIQADLAALQRRVLLKEQSEKQKADVRVSYVQQVRRHAFVFENWGPSTAYDVRFELLIPDGQHNPLIDSELKNTFPIDALRVGEKVSMLVAVNLDTEFPLTGQISWRSAGGELERAPCRITG
ncbi:MAG TPA: hypothetical protein VKC56_02690 [Gallionellaceae bacterium]|nr:hypothetical protein [Gallionellaceae bacterium]